MHSTNLRLFFGKRLLENGEEPIAKKPKLDNITLSNILDYNKQIFSLVSTNKHIHPHQILYQLIFRKIPKTNTVFFTDEKFTATNNLHGEFENELLAHLTKTDPAGDTIVLDVIPIINNYLRHVELHCNDNLFGLLIAFFYYYIDYYRINFNSNLESFVHFKERIFIPLEIYRKQQNEQKESHFIDVLSNAIFRLIERHHKKNLFQSTYNFLNLSSLTNTQKEKLLTKLLPLALNLHTKNQVLNIQYIRYGICLAIKSIGMTENITEYLNNIALPLYYFSHDQYVRKTGCQLLGEVFPLLSPEQADDIFAKLMQSLEHGHSGLEEVEGTCLALASIKLTKKQVDEAFPKLLALLDNDKKGKYTTICYSIEEAIFSMDISFEKLKELGNPHTNIIGYLRNILIFLEANKKDTAFYEQLIDWLLNLDYIKSILIFFACTEIFASIPLPVSRQNQVFEFINSYIKKAPASVKMLWQNKNISKVLAATKQIEANEIIFNSACDAIQLNTNNFLTTDFNFNHDVTRMLTDISLTPDQETILRKKILEKYKESLSVKNLNVFKLPFEIMTSLQMHFDEINHSVITNENFPDIYFFIKALINCSIKIDFKEIMIIDEFLKYWRKNEDNNFINEARKLIGESLHREDQLDPPEKQKKILANFKNLLTKCLLQFFDLQTRKHYAVKNLRNYALSLLAALNQPDTLMSIMNILCRNESWDFQHYIDPTNELFLTLIKMTKQQMAANHSFYHLNLVCLYECLNENKFYTYQYKFMQMIRDESAASLAWNLAAKEHELPSEIIEKVSQLKLI